MKFMLLLALSFSVFLINGKTLKKDFHGGHTDFVKKCAAGYNCGGNQYYISETERNLDYQIGNKNGNERRIKRANGKKEEEDKNENDKKRKKDDTEQELEPVKKKQKSDSNVVNSPYSPKEPKKNVKKNQEQLEKLQSFYKNNKNPNPLERKKIADELNKLRPTIMPNSVDDWFRHQRQKDRKGFIWIIISLESKLGKT